jgi:hypothetical protein
MMYSELTYIKAFAVFSFFRNLGIFGGTLIGALANPAEQYEGIFKRIEFFSRFPYAFPTLIAGVVVICTLLISIFYIKETLDFAKANHPNKPKQMSFLELLKFEGVGIVLFIWCMASLLGFAFTAGKNS